MVVAFYFNIIEVNKDFVEKFLVGGTGETECRGIDKIKAPKCFGAFLVRDQGLEPWTP